MNEKNLMPKTVNNIREKGLKDKMSKYITNMNQKKNIDDMYMPKLPKQLNVALQKTNISPIEETMRPKCKGHIRTYVRHRNICSIRLILKTRRNCNCSNFAPMCDFLRCIYVASIFNATYMHLKKSHLYAIRRTTRHMTHLKKRICKKCDVGRT